MTATGFLVEWLLRSSALIVMGSLLAWLCRVASPRVRLTIWTVLLGGSLAIPLMRFALPNVPLYVIRQTTQSQPAVPAIVLTASDLPPAETPPATIPVASARPVVRTLDIAGIVAGLYLMAVGFLLSRLFVGIAFGLRIVRRSTATGMRTGGAEIRESNEVASPITAGILRPVVLLPPDWREWEAARLDTVLAHENSHIRRLDPALQLLSAIHRAVLWVSPLSWFLHRRIVRIAEEVSDDDAIARTHDPVSYAETLLDFMQRESRPPNWAGVAMARYERPGKRIRRILNSSTAPIAISRRGFTVIVAAGTVLAFFAAASQPTAKAPLIVKLPRRETQHLARIGQPPRTLLAQAKLPDAAAKAQSPDTNTNVQPAFEVASVRPAVMGEDPKYAGAYAAGAMTADSQSPCFGGKLELSGFRVRLTFASICDIVRIAYGVRNFEVVGAPKAQPITLAEALDLHDKPLPVFFYDIEATAPGQQPLNDGLVRAMLRSLLADRFGLAVHRETRELSIYALIADKRGLKSETRPSPDCKPGFGDFSQLCDQTMDKVVRNLSHSLDRPVVDMTGITESFQYKVPDLRTDPDREANTRAAILDQLGLKLEPRKGPMEVIVVDRVSPPSPN